MKPWENNLGCWYPINWPVKPQRNICQLYENGRRQLELLLNQGSIFSIDNVMHVYHNFNHTTHGHSSTKCNPNSCWHKGLSPALPSQWLWFWNKRLWILYLHHLQNSGIGKIYNKITATINSGFWTRPLLYEGSKHLSSWCKQRQTKSFNIMVPTTVWGDISSLHLQSVTWSSKILNLDHHATHGFFTFLTDEELEADSLRFLCSNKKQIRSRRGVNFSGKNPQFNKKPCKAKNDIYSGRKCRRKPYI